MAEWTLIEVRSELGAGTRGASLGIDAVKIAAHDFGSRFFHRTDRLSVPDCNEQLYEPVRTPFARHIGGITEVCRNVADSVQSVLQSGRFPLVLAGDHSSAAGTIFGLHRALAGKRLGVVWIDAHADLHSPYTTLSGNMHGMSLAIAAGEDNFDCKVNEPDERTRKAWDQIKKIGGDTPPIHLSDVVYVALRDREPQEEYLIRKHACKIFQVSQIRRQGVEKVANAILTSLDRCDAIYVSFDVDSLDPRVSQGTGTPVPNGINEREAGKLLQNLVGNPKVICFEMVEINPTLDKENIMAETAFEILVKVANSIQNQNLSN
ncbi:MAG: arginase [Sphingomonadales bacterium]|nr:arginase [Sphingomonadales bacterium]